MNELIKITYDNDRPTVSARELHEFLEVETPDTTIGFYVCVNMAFRKE